MQGCSFNCKGCFNPETHDFDGGKDFNEDTVNEILNLSKKDYIKGLSILGGEPLNAQNIDGTILLSKSFKEKFPDKDIWVWTGFEIENLNEKQQEILKYIDVLVDGQYVESLNNPALNFRGSSNQRVIDVKETLEKDKLILVEFEDEERQIKKQRKNELEM